VNKTEMYGEETGGKEKIDGSARKRDRGRK
jgi:hypothetical protein